MGRNGFAGLGPGGDGSAGSILSIGSSRVNLVDRLGGVDLVHRICGFYFVDRIGRLCALGGIGGERWLRIVSRLPLVRPRLPVGQTNPVASSPLACRQRCGPERCGPERCGPERCGPQRCGPARRRQARSVPAIGLAAVLRSLRTGLSGGGSGSARGTAQRGQAVRVLPADSRPSSATEVSRILNFCTLPVTVIGKSSVIRT